MQKCTDRKAIAWIWALGKCAVMQSFLFRLNFLLQEVLIHCRGHFCTQSCRLLLLIVSRVKVSTSCGFCASMPLLCLFSCYMSSACEVHSEVHTLCRIEVVLNKTDFMSPQKHLTRHLKVFCKHAGSDDSLVWLRGEVLLVPE